MVIIVTFGPVTVLFAYISQVGNALHNDQFLFELLATLLFYSLPLALNTEAILHANNTRDLQADKNSGIITVAIFLGYKGSYILYVVLVFVPYLIFLVMSAKYDVNYLLPFLTIKLALDLENDFRNKKFDMLPLKTAKLNLIFGVLYVISCVLAK